MAQEKEGTQKGALTTWAREIDTYAPPYMFVQRLFPYPVTRRYPFRKDSYIAKQSFAEQCLASPEVDEPTKDMLAECTIIESTPVCRYLYEESDQETWRIDRDYPNIAPPFEHFWIETQAPRYVNSEESGVLPWSKSFPMTWGVLCRGADLWQQAEQVLADSEAQAFFIQSCLHILAQVDGEWARFMRRHNLPVDAEGEAITRALAAEREETRAYLGEFVTLRHMLALAEAGAWRGVREHMLQNVGAKRWHLDMWLVAKYRASADTYRILGPLWQMQTDIGEDGAVVKDEQGAPRNRTRAVGDMVAAIDSFSYTAGVTTDEGARVLFEAYNALFNPAFLAISFLHCKNVTLSEREHAPAAKKRRPPEQAPGAKDARPFFRYHTLNIEPMRQVLKTEGRAGELGTKHALHIARGHFRHYENGRGLFGKYHGTYWIPQHVRGALREGIASKDYTVKPPRQAEAPRKEG